MPKLDLGGEHGATGADAPSHNGLVNTSSLDGFATETREAGKVKVGMV